MRGTPPTRHPSLGCQLSAISSQLEAKSESDDDNAIMWATVKGGLLPMSIGQSETGLVSSYEIAAYVSSSILQVHFCTWNYEKSSF